MDEECGVKQTVKDFERERTKDSFMNKRSNKKREMTLVEMYLELVKKKRQLGGDGRESITKMTERALGGTSGERRAKVARVRREGPALKNASDSPKPAIPTVILSCPGSMLILGVQG